MNFNIIPVSTEGDMALSQCLLQFIEEMLCLIFIQRDMNRSPAWMGEFECNTFFLLIQLPACIIGHPH